MNENNYLVQNNFNKAANNYLQNSDIQKEPALQVISNLAECHSNGLILDLGSGPSTLAHSRCLSYNNATISFDISMEMLKHIDGKLKINGDANNLPFANNSFSTVISNLMIQWSENKKAVIQEVYRVIKLNGLFIFTTLITPSLHELQTSWEEVDDLQHTLQFINLESYHTYLLESGFTIIKSKIWSRTIYFNSVYEIFSHFKNTGTNLPKSPRQGLGGKEKLKKLAESYKKHKTTQGLPLTYVYLIIVAIKKGS